MRRHRLSGSVNEQSCTLDSLKERNRMMVRARGMAGMFWIVGLLTMIGSHGGAAQNAPVSREISGRQAGQGGPLSARMDRFLAAVRAGNLDSISTFFPRRGEWIYQRTTYLPRDQQVGVWRFRAEDTPTAIRAGPLTASFRMDYEGQVVGSLIHQLKHREGRWRPLSGFRFVPPGGTETSDIYVLWRREEGEWVISTLAEQAYAGAKLPAWCC